jgi:hypothetical protein
VLVNLCEEKALIEDASLGDDLGKDDVRKIARTVIPVWRCRPRVDPGGR